MSATPNKEKNCMETAFTLYEKVSVRIIIATPLILNNGRKAFCECPKPVIGAGTQKRGCNKKIENGLYRRQMLLLLFYHTI
jgi:hypothetical protein